MHLQSSSGREAKISFDLSHHLKSVKYIRPTFINSLSPVPKEHSTSAGGRLLLTIILLFLKTLQNKHEIASWLPQ